MSVRNIPEAQETVAGFVQEWKSGIEECDDSESENIECGPQTPSPTAAMNIKFKLHKGLKVSI